MIGKLQSITGIEFGKCRQFCMGYFCYTAPSIYTASWNSHSFDRIDEGFFPLVGFARFPFISNEYKLPIIFVQHSKTTWAYLCFLSISFKHYDLYRSFQRLISSHCIKKTRNCLSNISCLCSIYMTIYDDSILRKTRQIDVLICPMLYITVLRELLRQPDNAVLSRLADQCPLTLLPCFHSSYCIRNIRLLPNCARLLWPLCWSRSGNT